jgi:hypothetical protein
MLRTRANFHLYATIESPRNRGERAGPRPTHGFRATPEDLERALVRSPAEAELLWLQLALGLESG